MNCLTPGALAAVGACDFHRLLRIATRPWKRIIFALSCGILLAASTPLLAQQPSSGRAVTVVDIVEAVHLLREFPSGRAFHTSPDGRAAFFLSSSGDVARREKVMTLYVYRRIDLVRAHETDKRAAPFRTLVARSSSNLDPIAEPQWSSDGRSIVFLYATGEKPAQVASFDTVSNAITLLTNESAGVRSYSLGCSVLVYAAIFEEDQNIDVNRVVESGSIYDLFGSIKSAALVPYRLMAKVEGILIDLDSGPLLSRDLLIRVSPDGRYVIAVGPAPPNYSSGLMEGSARQCYILYDLKKSARTPILDCRFGHSVTPAMAMWKDDSQHVILADVSISSGQGRAQSAVVEYDVRARTATVVTTLADWRPGIDLSEDAAYSEIVPIRSDSERRRVGLRRLALGSDGAIEIFERIGADWVRIDGTSGQTNSPVPAVSLLACVEDVNTPPQIVFPTGNGDADPVLDLNPQFHLLSIRPTREISWVDASGRKWTGGLTLPAGASASSPVPLVLQVHGWQPDRFSLGGMTQTAFATQALVSRGVAVLQVNLRDVEGMGTPQEGASFIEGVRGAIEHLARTGEIDASRIGLVGWSRGGYLIKYAISHGLDVGAATTSDSFDGSYIQYIFRAVADEPSDTAGYIGANGGTFWESQARWLEQAPGFNADAIATPLRLEALGPAGALAEWELFGALRLLGKPVELALIPEGPHTLQRPQDRVFSLEGTVDWMAFWLKNYEDPNPEKAAQYDRWRKLREQRDAIRARGEPHLD